MTYTLRDLKKSKPMITKEDIEQMHTGRVLRRYMKYGIHSKMRVFKPFKKVDCDDCGLPDVKLGTRIQKGGLPYGKVRCPSCTANYLNNDNGEHGAF